MTRSTDTYEHAISGLLQKRAEQFHEAERIRDRLAEIKNDIGALDRTLRSLGYEGELDAMMPKRYTRVFGQGELLDACLRELRHAERPLKSREIAQSIIALRGDDARDRRHVTDITRRLSKCLRIERERGTVRGRLESDRTMTWEWVGQRK
jgi:hypothetical protein